MYGIFEREAVYLWYYASIQLQQIAPYWALGILIGSCVSLFGKSRIHGLFSAMTQKRLGALGLIPASALGIASPLCMYGAIPIAASFSEKGMPDDWLAAFMMSSVLLNPQLIAYSAALGQRVVILRVLSCFLCGVAAGLCIRYLCPGRRFFNFSGLAEPPSRDSDPRVLLRLIKNVGRNVRATGGYFLLGIAISALFQRYVPEGALASLFGNYRRFGVFLAATVGVPLYACGGGTIPLIEGWLHSGMSLGAAGAFMLTGPATKITNLGALKIVLGVRHFAFYLIFTMLFATITGLAVNACV